MFTKADRSTFPYWFAHWCAFNMTALVLKQWKFKYLFHDFEKPWLKLFMKDYKKVQKWHRCHNNHHLEYPGKKDWMAMYIDWECSRFTKQASPLTAYEEMKKKVQQFYDEVKNENLEHLTIGKELEANFVKISEDLGLIEKNSHKWILVNKLFYVVDYNSKDY